ncbi:MAG TPA: PAS domain-containing protein [Pyrinomonadaceae bacterium]|jgi:PAS domain S-box-containing protein|nr:PAS domain-containing protein [Pyrinomonadaceae bacterium]
MLPEERTDEGPHPLSERQRGFINALLENVEDGVVACDSEGVITVFNHAARRMHGRDERPIAADRWADYYDLYLPDGRTRMRKEEIPLFRALQGERVHNAEMIIAPEGREPHAVLASGGAVYGPDGEKLGAVVVMRDFTEQREAQEALRRESALLHALMDNIPDAIYFKDTGGRFTRVNSHAPYRGNKAPEEVVGKTDFDFFVEEHARAAFEDEQRVMRTGVPIIDKEECEVYPDGSTTWLSTTKVPVFDDAGRVTGIVGISRDITERKHAEESRLELAREQAARTEAEHANRLKDEFLAVLSHELRTPLTAILGWSKMLMDGHVAEETRPSALTSIYRNAKSQAQLIDDLLDISRIITGRLSIETKPVELASIVETAVASVRPAAQAKSLTLETKVDALAGAVTGDADRLQQVVWNLLTNAIKFTPKGGLVEVRLARAGSCVEVEVRDTGQGIEQEFLPHVFDRFRQADSSTTRRHGGLGLGLSIVRHLVELHGGTAHAESAGHGQGSAFKVVLPSAARESDGEEPVEETSPAAAGGSPVIPHSLEGLKVLVVDDDADARELLAEILNQCGAHVRTAASASKALEVLGLWLPDVLLSDIGMPEGDGYAFIERVRALPVERGGAIPAAALTAYAGAEDRARVLSSGYQAHVAKPVEPASLSALVAELAGRAVVS